MTYHFPPHHELPLAPFGVHTGKLIQRLHIQDMRVGKEIPTVSLAAISVHVVPLLTRTRKLPYNRPHSRELPCDAGLANSGIPIEDD